MPNTEIISYISANWNSPITFIYSGSGFTSLRTFTADEDHNSHDQAVLAQAECGDRTVTLLLAQVAYPVEVWDTTIRFWQVVGEKWEPDRPQTRLDRNLEGGMAVSLGRLREDSQYDYKFVCLSHNTLRGAAGGAVLLAELLCAENYI